MAWSYRQDRSDEVYHDQVGVGLVEAEKLPHTPASSTDSAELLDPKKKEKRLEDEKKFKEEQLKESQTAPEREHMNAERERIRTEEQNRVTREEQDKKLDQIRKEEADKANKNRPEAPKSESEGPRPPAKR